MHIFFYLILRKMLNLIVVAIALVSLTEAQWADGPGYNGVDVAAVAGAGVDGLAGADRADVAGVDVGGVASDRKQNKKDVERG